MPLINPDTSEAGAIQPGTYKGTIRAADPGTSKGGNQKIVIKAELEVNGKMKTRYDHMPIAGAGAFKFDNLLRACGMHALADQYRDPSQPNPPFDTDSLVGQELNVIVENDMYEGNVTDKISRYLPK